MVEEMNQIKQIKEVHSEFQVFNLLLLSWIHMHLILITFIFLFKTLNILVLLLFIFHVFFTIIF